MTSSTIWAGECAEGKSPVHINLPNGMQKTICLNDSALPGLQNAAEHSDGTIVPTTCPCWNETDIKYYLSNKMFSMCSYDVLTSIVTCVDDSKQIVLEAYKPEFSCVNYVTKVEAEKLTAEQWNACLSLLPLM